MHDEGLPRFSFTGSKGRLSRGQEAILARAIESLPRPSVVITGACIGVDAYVARYARMIGHRVHTIVPSDRSRVDPDWRGWCDSFLEMPEGTTYRDRNVFLVREGTSGLLAFPEYAEIDARSQRSGTWQTVRIARSLHGEYMHGDATYAIRVHPLGRTGR